MTQERINDQITEWLKNGEENIKELLADYYAFSDAEAGALWIQYTDKIYGANAAAF